jgi:hypothetical protein
MWLDDLLAGTPLTATSSIYPATQAASQVASGLARHEEVDTLLPWGCERFDQAPTDQT